MSYWALSYLSMTDVYFLFLFPSHVLLTLVCSSNFYIYYMKHGSLCKKEESRSARCDLVEMQERTSIRRGRDTPQEFRWAWVDVMIY
jgi:hypothetical protein